MAVKDAKAFVEKLKTDSVLLAKLQAAKDDAAKQKIAHDLGYDFSKDDLKTLAQQNTAELSDEDLEAVAGGSGAAWMGVGLGVGGAVAGGIGAAAAAAA
jgi:predicted ribosomally synthesized peptide with nif11-like leader